MRRVAIVCLTLALGAIGASAAPNVWLFDFGGPETPVWPGFAQVTPESIYAEDAGFGWLGRTDGLRAFQATRIDGLAIDDISSAYDLTDQFRVDVPEGDYTVWVLSGAMGNIWRQRYMREAHSLLINGDVAETIDYPEEKLFEVADYDWRPQDDLWDYYIGSRFAWYKHDATAVDGAIVLGFEDHRSFPVNAVVIAERSIAGRVQGEIDRIDEMRRSAWHGIWREDRPEPEAPAETSKAERQRGYVVAEVHCSDDLSPWSQPAESASREQIELFATPGEQEQASLAVFGLRDLQDVTISVGAMTGDAGATLPGATITPKLVQFAPWHSGRRDVAAYAVRECLVMPLRPTFVGEGTCKRFWLTIDTPEDAAPGIYRGAVSVTAANAPPTEMQLVVRVVPVNLQTPPVERFMYFGTMYYLGKAYLPNGPEERYWDAMRAEVRFMRDNQYCRAECIIPRGSGAVKMDGDRVVSVDLSDTERLMQILREEDAWPRDNRMTCRTGGLNIMFGGHFNRPNNPGVEFIPTEEGREKYREAIRYIDDYGKAHDWPEIAFECLGEFTNYGEQGKQFAIDVHTLLHEMGVSNTIRGNGPMDMAAIELGLVKYPQPNWAMMYPEQLEVMRRTGAELWAYNFTRSRFSMGWFCRRHGITRASYESGVYVNGQPGNLFEIETMFPMGLPTSMTTIEPTVWLKRLVQGATDYSYLWNLDRLIEQARASDSAEAKRIADEAQAWLDGKLADIPAGSTYVRGDPRTDQDVQGRFWPVHDLDRYRWRAAEYVMALEGVLG